MPTTRRAFLSGAAAAVATATAGPRLAFAAGPTTGALPLFVHVHLRGGLDSLRLLAPRTGAARAAYEAARPTLAVPTARLLALDATVDGAVGLHPAAEPLLDAWSAGRLAVVPAAGLERAPSDRAAAERAFAAASADGFDAETATELGFGWLARHLETSTERHDEVFLPAVGLGRGASALEGSGVSWSAETLESLRVDGFDEPLARGAIEALQAGDARGRQTVASLEIAGWLRAGPPREESAAYPSSDIGRQLARVAAIDAEGLGLRVASVTMDGWDLRDDEPGDDGSGDAFARRVAELSHALAALDRDFARRGLADRLLVVVESESGRSIGETRGGGTTLGHASPMLILGGRVAGGVHGGWPPLTGDALAPTIDRRAVLAQAVEHHLGNPVAARALRAAAFAPAAEIVRP